MFHKHPSSDVKMWKIVSQTQKLRRAKEPFSSININVIQSGIPKTCHQLDDPVSTLQPRLYSLGETHLHSHPSPPNPANHCRAIRPSHRISRFIPWGQTLLASQPPQIGLYFLHYFSYFPLCGAAMGRPRELSRSRLRLVGGVRRGADEMKST